MKWRLLSREDLLRSAVPYGFRGSLWQQQGAESVVVGIWGQMRMGHFGEISNRGDVNLLDSGCSLKIVLTPFATGFSVLGRQQL